MKIFNLMLLLAAILQTPNFAYARYCDDPDYQPPSGCRCSSYNLICSRPRTHIVNLEHSATTLGLAPYCSPANKKNNCEYECSTYDSDSRAYLNIQCFHTCMDIPCR